MKQSLIILYLTTAVAIEIVQLTLAQAYREHKVHNIVLYPDKHSWCQTTTIKQVINYPGCTSVEIDNNVCVGACFSYSIPHTEPSDPGEVIVPYCDSCQPSDTTWHQITLQCDKYEPDTPPQLIKHVQIIHNCTCTSCEKDRYLSISSASKLNNADVNGYGGSGNDDITGDLIHMQEYQHYEQAENTNTKIDEKSSYVVPIQQLIYHGNQTLAETNHNSDNENTKDQNKNDDIVHTSIDRWKKMHPILSQKIYTLIKNIQNNNNTKYEKEQLFDLINVMAHNPQYQNKPSINELIETLRSINLEPHDIQRLNEIEHLKPLKKHKELLKHHINSALSNIPSKNIQSYQNSNDNEYIYTKNNDQKLEDNKQSEILQKNLKYNEEISIDNKKINDNVNKEETENVGSQTIGAVSTKQIRINNSSIDDVEEDDTTDHVIISKQQEIIQYQENETSSNDDDGKTKTSDIKATHVFIKQNNDNHENHNENENDDDDDDDENVDNDDDDISVSVDSTLHMEDEEDEEEQQTMDHRKLKTATSQDNGKQSNLHEHHINENIVPHGHLTRGPHGSLIIEPDRVHEKIDVNAHELKPNHAGTLLSYNSHSEESKKQ